MKNQPKPKPFSEQLKQAEDERWQDNLPRIYKEAEVATRCWRACSTPVCALSSAWKPSRRRYTQMEAQEERNLRR